MINKMMVKSPIIFKRSRWLEVDVWEWVLSKSGSLVGSVVMAHVDDVMEWTPGDDGGFLVPEPFAGHSWQVSVVHVWNSGGDFCSWNDSVQVGNLSSVSGRLLDGVVSFQQIVPVGVSGSEDFNGVDLNEEKSTWEA